MVAWVGRSCGCSWRAPPAAATPRLLLRPEGPRRRLQPPLGGDAQPPRRRPAPRPRRPRPVDDGSSVAPRGALRWRRRRRLLWPLRLARSLAPAVYPAGGVTWPSGSAAAAAECTKRPPWGCLARGRCPHRTAAAATPPPSARHRRRVQGCALWRDRAWLLCCCAEPSARGRWGRGRRSEPVCGCGFGCGGGTGTAVAGGASPTRRRPTRRPAGRPALRRRGVGARGRQG